MNEPEALREFPEVRDSFSGLMRTLFDIGCYKDDLLPYRKAALIFTTMDEEWMMDSAREQATARNNKGRGALECALVNGEIEVAMMLTYFQQRQ